MSTPVDDLSARLDRIESRLDRLTAMLDDALPTIGMAADAADEFVGGLQERGIDVDQRVHGVSALIEKATEPATLERLTHLVEQLDRLQPLIEVAATFEHTTGMAFDILDAQIARLQDRGVNVDRRLQGVARLLETATDADTMARLDRMLGQMDRLEPVVDLAATFQSTTGMVFDMVDAQVSRLQEQGIDPETRIGQVLQMATRITDPDFHQHLETLLDAAPALISATRTGEVFGRAIDDVANAGNPEPVNVWGLLRALRDPHVQRAAGFAVAVARRVGERLPQLPARS